MKSKLTVVLGALFMASLSGCLSEGRNDIGGHLTVKQAISLKMKNDADEILQPSEYAAILHMTDKGSDLEVQTRGVSLDLVIPNPKADQLGKFTISAADAGQSYDMNGEVAENTTSTPVSGSDTCIFAVENHIVCHEVIVQGPQGPVVHEVCENMPHYIYGSQSYNAIHTLSMRTAQLNLVDPATKAVVASFSGAYKLHESFDQKVYTSTCIPY